MPQVEPWQHLAPPLGLAVYPTAPPPSLEPELVTIEQAAELLAVGVTTTRALIADGRLPSVAVTPRAVRVRVADLRAFVAGLEVAR